MTLEEVVDQLRDQLADRITRRAPDVRSPYDLANRLIPDVLTFVMEQLGELVHDSCGGAEEEFDVHKRYCVPALDRRDELGDERDQTAANWP